MPTNCNETTWERYQREHEEYLAMLAKFSPKDIFALQHQLHNALALLEQARKILADSRERAFYEDMPSVNGILFGDICSRWFEHVNEELK